MIGGSANNIIGGVTPKPSDLISGNAGNGETLAAGRNGNIVISNFIGLDRLGLPLHNSGVPLLNAGTSNLTLDNSVSP